MKQPDIQNLEKELKSLEKRFNSDNYEIDDLQEQLQRFEQILDQTHQSTANGLPQYDLFSKRLNGLKKDFNLFDPNSKYEDLYDTDNMDLDDELLHFESVFGDE